MADAVETIRMEVRFDEADMDRAAKAAEASINKGRAGGGGRAPSGGGGGGGKGGVGSADPSFSKRIAESFGQAFQSRIQGMFQKVFGAQAGGAAGGAIGAKVGGGVAGAIGKLGALGAIGGLVVAGFTQLLGAIKNVAQGLAEYNGGIAYSLALMENTWDRIMFSFADAMAPAVEAIADIFMELEPLITAAMKAFAGLLSAVAAIAKILIIVLKPVLDGLAYICDLLAVAFQYAIGAFYKAAGIFTFGETSREMYRKSDEAFAKAADMANELGNAEETAAERMASPPGWWSPSDGTPAPQPTTPPEPNGTPSPTPLPGQAPPGTPTPASLPGQAPPSPANANPRPVYMPGPLASPTGPSLTVHANLHAQAAVQTAIEQARGFLLGQLDRMTDETRFLAMQMTGSDIARML